MPDWVAETIGNLRYAMVRLRRPIGAALAVSVLALFVLAAIRFTPVLNQSRAGLYADEIIDVFYNNASADESGYDFGTGIEENFL